MIDLRSDTVTKPTAGMRQAIAEAVVGDDVFESDPTVQRLEALTAELFGKEAALFVPSGTMGNQICLNTWTSPGNEIILDYESHIACYEVGTAAAFSGLQMQMISCPDSIMRTEDMLAAIRIDDIHCARTRVVCLENTHNRGGGAVIPLEAMQEISDAAHDRGLVVHLDGARLWNASAATGVPLADYAATADSVMSCLSKALGAPVGSIITGSRDFITEARRTRKMFGGGMRQVGILAAAGIYALEHHLPKLAEDHVKAQRFAEIVGEHDQLAILPDPPPTNIIVIDLARTGKDVMQVYHRLHDDGVWLVPFGATRIRAVAHLDVTIEDMETAARTVLRVIDE